MSISQLVPTLPNFASLLWNTAALMSLQDAVVTGDRVTSYGALRDRAGALASVLSVAGLRPGDRVGLFLERGPDAAAGFFGVLAAGGVAVNINENLRPRQVEYILGHCGANTLLTSSELLARLPRSLNAPGTTITTVESVPAAAWFDPVRGAGMDVAQIIYTSGSTGLPKGVVVSHQNLLEGARAVTSYLAISRRDRIASLLPFSFDYGLNQLLCAVSTGATLVVERASLADTVVRTLHDQKVTVLPCVPPLWLQLLDVQNFRSQPVPSLRAMTNTGGRLPATAVRELRQAQPHAQLFLMYGLTEAFRSTYLPPEEADRRPDSIGRAIPGAEILVVKEDGSPCAPGEVGELVHRGPTVTMGYWNDPEATSGVFRANPLRPPGAPSGERVVFSGDLVRRDEDGFLYFVGRRDGMIKTLGYRVSPDEVAEVVYASGEVGECIVRAEPDDVRGARIVAFVVLKEGGSLERLTGFCRTELPRYMQPARFEVRDSLPRTTSGKHDGKVLQ